jgi:ABC-type polysaccharide/polyol phosphate transport system ATPase subunit
MSDIFIAANGISLSIPIYEHGAMRLFRKPASTFRVGGRLEKLQNRPAVRALNNVSFSAKPGDKIALLGHNGSGKTTLLRVLCGLYPCDPKTLSISGNMGVVLDTGTGVIDELTGFQCIDLYCKYKGLTRQKSKEVVDDIADFSELGDFLYLPVRTYSAGMRARLAAGLATCLAYDILLIDEGIGAGDAAFQDKFQKRIVNYLGKSSILIIASHNDQMLKDYCNRCLVMEKGEIVCDADLNTAFTQYHALAA